MTTLVVGASRVAERVVARCLVRGGVAAHALAERADEATLARLPAPAWCDSQEANLFALARLNDVRWRRVIARAAGTERVDPERLERLVSQIFTLSWGQRLEVIRMCLAVLDGPRIRLASDLPLPLRRALLDEFDGRVMPARIASVALRAIGTARDLGRAMARHAVRMLRLVRLRRLPSKRDSAPPYVAWLGALPSEVDNAGPDKLSLTAFLAEAREGAAVGQVVIQGAAPEALPEEIVHRAHLPALRYAPSWWAISRAVIAQARRALRDLAGAFDFQRRTLLSEALMDLPGLRLWFKVDRPAAVLYSNATIGAEPRIALLATEYGVPSMMVFYSANVCHRHKPSRWVGPSIELEPEQRFIIADRLTMWSAEMAGAFLGAGYPRARLVETGPVVFARQRDFTPTSRFLTGRPGPIRIGIFDVLVFKPQRRFELGCGQLIYNADFTLRFFHDILAAARARFGDDFVVVRKLKRALGHLHADDVDFSRLPPANIVGREPDESLWRVLEGVDVVVCMPFTSVAYLADAYGIPAAYYDPTTTVERSPLGGGAALLSGRDALEAWLGAPTQSVPRDIHDLVGPVVLAAALGAMPAPDAGARVNQRPFKGGTRAVHT